MNRERALEVRRLARRRGGTADCAAWLRTLTEDEALVAADELLLLVDDLSARAGVALDDGIRTPRHAFGDPEVQP